MNWVSARAQNQFNPYAQISCSSETNGSIDLAQGHQINLTNSLIQEVLGWCKGTKSILISRRFQKVLVWCKGTRPIQNQLGFLEVWVGARAPNQLKPNSKFPEVLFWCKGTKIKSTFKVSGSLVWCKGTKFEPRSIVLKLVGARVLIKIVVKEFWCKGIKSQKSRGQVSWSFLLRSNKQSSQQFLEVSLSGAFVGRWPVDR